MKTIKLVAMFALVACLVSSCSVAKTVSSAKELTPRTDLLVADLDVNTAKVTGEFRYDTKKNAIVDVKGLIDNAVYNALKPMKADVLVGMQYQLVQEVRGRKYYTVTVTGYPAFYRNFRPFTAVKDVEFKEIDGSVYVIPKNSNGEPTGYQVVVPTDKYANIIDMEAVSLDKIVFDGTGASVLGDGAVHEGKGTIKDEPKGIFSSLKQKGKEKKSKKNK